MNFLTNNKRIFVFYAMIFVFVFSLFQPAKTLAADPPPNSPPSVTISNVKVVGDTATITGTVSDDSTPAGNITLQLYDSEDQPQFVTSISPSTDGSWTMSKALTGTVGNYYIKANDGFIDSEKYPVQDSRLFVKSLTITAFLSKKRVMNNGTEEIVEDDKTLNMMNTDDLTHISLNPTITIEISNGDLLDQQIIDNPTQYSPVTVTDGKNTINGTIMALANNQIEIKFQNLAPSTTYYIRPNSNYLDDDRTTLYPFNRKFTTVSNAMNNLLLEEGKYLSDPEPKYISDWPAQPHGYYINNVNTCSICHSAHYGDNNSLEIKNGSSKTLQDGYCMACHDGTSAPRMDDFGPDIISKHDETKIFDHKMKSGSCTACHNPHLTWSENNPNLLQDHTVYTHDTADMNDGEPVGKIDSNQQLCEKCHELNTDFYINNARKIAAEKTPPDPDPYQISHYQRFSSLGLESSYDLCFNCHNADKETKDGTKNILQYYQDDPSIVSMHKLNAVDGSQLNGYLPCSECHETHGSTNLLLLKTKLGHENQTDFVFTTGSFDASTERQFCMKCHNGSTAIYGITGKALDTTKSSGHLETDTRACSTCHGTGNTAEEKALSAAHAPVQAQPDPGP